LVRTIELKDVARVPAGRWFIDRLKQARIKARLLESGAL